MNCVFCEIVAGRERASLVFADDRVLALMTLHPSQPGECMVIPRQHIDHFTDLPDDLATHLLVIGQRLGRKMRQVFSPVRVGLAVAGFGVPHAHLILVPQHNPDDITSGRYARIVDGRVVFEFQGPIPSRDLLDQQALSLRLSE
jgi:histidine triad (HIT) family protein